MAKLLDSVKELGGKIAGEEIEGDTLIEAVRDAGQKMTGKEIKGKELNDVIKETADNYHGGGGGGGLDPVDELPETGDVKSLYKLPDGSIWSWYSKIKEETIEEHVELGKQYQFKFSGIDKTKIKDFLEVVKSKVVELYNQGSLPETMNDDFGPYNFLVEDNLAPGIYVFPVPVSITFDGVENSNEPILAAIGLLHNVENKMLIDSTSDRVMINADIYVEIYVDDGNSLELEYTFQNPLNKESYNVEIEQKWYGWNDQEGTPIICTEEQIDSLKVEINSEWLEHMKTTYNFDIDLTMLDFLFKLRSETVVIKDEGYRRLDDPQIKAVKGGGNIYGADDGLIFDGEGVEFDGATNRIVINDENSYIDLEGVHLISGSGAGEGEWVAPNITYVQTPTKKRDTGKILRFNGKDVVASNALPYLTEEPTGDNADGLILVVIDHEPAVKYDGYLYIITESEEGPLIPEEPLN